MGTVGWTLMYLAIDWGAFRAFKLQGNDKDFYINVLLSGNVDDRLRRKS